MGVLFTDDIIMIHMFIDYYQEYPPPESKKEVQLFHRKKIHRPLLEQRRKEIAFLKRMNEDIPIIVI